MKNPVEKLAIAIISSYKGKGLDMAKDDAVDIAEYLLGFFGYGTEIIDNMLENYDRDIFYSMEEIGIVDTVKTVETLYNGKTWRLNKWRIRNDNIERLIAQDKKPIREDENIEDFYSKLFRDLENKESENGGLGLYNNDYASSVKQHEDIAGPGALKEEAKEEHSKDANVQINGSKYVTNGKIEEILSIFTMMLGSSIKPLIYICMEYPVEYTRPMIAKRMADILNTKISKIDKHINIKSVMESLVSIGAVESSTKVHDGNDITVYSKPESHEIFDFISAHGIMAMANHLTGVGLTLDDIFSTSVAPGQRVAQAHNIFGLIKLLAENPGSEFQLHEIQNILDSKSVRHEIRTKFSEKHILDYNSSPSSGIRKPASYEIMRSTSFAELVEKGFISRPNTARVLSKAIDFINKNTGNEVSRHDIAKVSGADLDQSSKYLVMLSKAGILKRNVVWNEKRSSIRANDNTLLVWDSALAWLYDIALESHRYSNNGMKIYEAIQTAIKSDRNYQGIKAYTESTELLDDARTVFEMHDKARKKRVRNTDVEKQILNSVEKGRNRVYEIKKELEYHGLSYEGTRWHIEQMLRKGILKKDKKANRIKSG